MTTPILHTPRLVLRPHGPQDFDGLKAIWMDPAVTRHIGGKASSEQECWFRLMRYLGLWSLLGFGYWAIERDGRYIGDAGLADFRRGYGDRFDGAPEAGWVLAREVAGQGLATEAMGAILDWHDRTCPGARTVCVIDDGNLASIRVAAKLGYSRFGTGPSGDAGLYERLRRP